MDDRDDVRPLRQHLDEQAFGSVELHLATRKQRTLFALHEPERSPEVKILRVLLLH